MILDVDAMLYYFFSNCRGREKKSGKGAGKGSKSIVKKAKMGPKND